MTYTIITLPVHRALSTFFIAMIYRCFLVCYKLNYSTYLHNTSVCSECYRNCYNYLKYGKCILCAHIFC